MNYSVILGPYGGSGGTPATRYAAACQFAAARLAAGDKVVSHPVNVHSLDVNGNQSLTTKQHVTMGAALIEKCDKVLIHMFTGWDTHVPVQVLVGLALCLGKTIVYYNSDGTPGQEPT